MSHAHVKTSVTKDEVTLSPQNIWSKMPMIGAALGLLGLGASAAMGLGGDAEHQAQFYFSYLVSYVYFVSLMLGGMFFVLVQHAARAGWSVSVRRLAETAAATAPLFALLFLPLLPGLHTLYHHWMEADLTDPILAHKASYLNESFFLIRAAICLIAWTIVGVGFYRASVNQDRLGDNQTTRKLQARSAPALFVFGITATVASLDWMMSLDPHWFSTMFGVYFFAGSVVAIFAFLALVVISLRASGALHGIITTEHDHDLGKFLFAFVVFWSYIAFSQYFLIWYANLPEETIFFAHRLHQGGWQGMSIFLAVGHFVVPFFFLMSRHIKRRPATLGLAAGWLLLMHFIDLYWVIMPTFHTDTVAFSLLDVTTFIGVGGLFLAVYSWLLGRHALVPMRDPRLPEALSFENF